MGLSVTLNGCIMLLHNYVVTYLAYVDGYHVDVISAHGSAQFEPRLPTECCMLMTSWSAVPWGA